MFTIKFKTKKVDDNKNDNCYFLRCLKDSTVPGIVKNVVTKHRNLFETKCDTIINSRGCKNNKIRKGEISSKVMDTCVPENKKQTYKKRRKIYCNNEKKKHIKIATKVLKCKLQVVLTPKISSNNFESISSDTLFETIEKYGLEFDDKFVLIDCRLPYQYKAGHIKGAINFYDIHEVLNYFFPKNTKKNCDIIKKVPIFYYTESKEPPVISKLREFDGEREIYPNIYLLDGGYENFYKEKMYRKYCDPCGYVKPSFCAYLKDKNIINKRRSKGTF